MNHSERMTARALPPLVGAVTTCEAPASAWLSPSLRPTSALIVPSQAEPFSAKLLSRLTSPRSHAERGNEGASYSCSLVSDPTRKLALRTEKQSSPENTR